ncbi:lysis protein [Escherichia coli]|uniref:lysis protein n=1 Tax=Escherichia coli TaxID=562 RepID=UPI0009722C65|nr:lysis protein [Escherichia coli]EHE4079506.1 lysis protein [Salmonella enterica subsp. enterica serovar Livingstone]EHR9639090.1 lysis protein [Escherichia coli]MCL7948684.1 lysis protein [Escherichia coli]OMI56766.1 lysis determining protein [Escherichia coli N37122PS]OMI61216.1 lysis protein [Escherichia coli N37139PS]
MIGWGVCVLALALADRYLLKRKDITHLELGDVEIKPGFIRVPFKYRSKFPFLRGATVRYWIRDVQKPTTVIEGEQRCLTSAEQGENSEWLYIPTEYMGKGERLWHFNVMVTHGDSFINPLYRIFPVTQQIRSSYVINLAQDVSDDEK